MATISIKDLANSVDLDREAMTAITGGARTRGSFGLPIVTTPRGNRIVDYPGGLKNTLLPPAGKKTK